MAKKEFLEGYQTYDTAGGFGNARQWRDTFKKRMGKQEAADFLRSQEKTPYDLLGIPAGASQATIKKAFYQLINEWHPDKNPHRLAEAEAMSKQLIAAYTVLTRR